MAAPEDPPPPSGPTPPDDRAPERPGPTSPDAPPPPDDRLRAAPAVKVEPPRYGRYVLLLALLILIGITVNTVVTKPNGDKGVPVGSQVPVFAAPLASSDLEGDPNTATAANQGEAGKVPACSVQDPRAMNVCDLYKGRPLVLALFVELGSCPDVLKEMQALSSSFANVQFAAVAIRNSHSATRKLVRKLGLTFPVAFDRQGVLAALYAVATCPQVEFIEPGGIVQSPALLAKPTPAELRERVVALVSASRAKGAG